jgi:pyruvate/2-oxoglutarate dehydrogenase complex dihydrolipoamide dehydrogenase (E3) component
MPVETYQNLIIGSGEAGKMLAWNLGKAGQRCAVVERALVGGSCPNIACLPSKNVIYSAKAVALANPHTGLGVLGGDLRVDMPGVFRRKREMVEKEVQFHLKMYKSAGTELVMGHARFTGPKTVEVALNAGGTRTLSGERVILCLGSRATIPPTPGLADAKPMTHVEALNLDRVPPHLVVLGGGYVGLEFAQAMRRFGSKVTIVQRGPRLLDREDDDIVAAMLEVLRDEGIEVLLGAEVASASGRSGERVELRVNHAGTTRTIEASDVLVAAGRTPNTDGADLDRANVAVDARGFIKVNERLQTSAPGVWAVGDCAGSPMFTHVGFDDFRVVFGQLTGDGKRTTTGRLVPYCLFTDPELAHVGLHERDARAAGMRYRVFKLPMANVLRAVTMGATRGFVKALVGPAGDDRILGFTALGADATEMMSTVQTAMLAGAPYTQLRDTIFTHPTMAEGLIPLFSGTPTDVS